MAKELIISIIIVVSIFIGNSFSQNYTKESVEEATMYLNELREEIMKEESEVDVNVVKQKIQEIHEKWDIRYEKLAYYIEHDELEKVETELTGIKGYLNKQDYTEAVAELDKSIYILEHIKNKNSFNFKNIF